MDHVALVLPNRYEPALTRYVDMVEQAEGLGYSTAWVTEVSGADAVGLACAAAVRTSHIRIATGILPVFTRTMPLLAMGAATLQSLSGGRGVLGLGVSTPNIVAGWHGQRFTAPMARLEDTVAGVRAVLAGRQRDFVGRTISSSGFVLGVEGVTELPIHVAALGPRNTATGARISDGVILTLCSRQGLAKIVASVRRQPSGDRPDVTCFIRVAVTDDEQAAIDWMRRELSWYVASEAYRLHFVRQGFGPQMKAVERARAAGDRAAVRTAIDDDMCRALAAIGSPSQVRAQLAHLLQTGTTEVACYFMDLGTGLNGLLAQMNSLVVE